MFTLNYNSYKKYKRIWTNIGASMLVFYLMYTTGGFVCTLFQSFFTNHISERAGEIAYSISSGAWYLAEFMLPVLFFKFISIKRVSMPNMQLDVNLPRILWLVIPASIAANLVLSYVNTLIVLPFNYEYIYDLMTPSYPDGYYLYHFVLDIINTAIIPAVCEEFLFRGLILMLLLPYGKKTAIFGSAVMFALMHQNFGQLIYTFGMGIVLALIAIETKSIWGGILLHFFNNLFSVVSSAITYMYPEVKATLLGNILVFAMLAVGGVCLICLVYKYYRSDRDLFEDDNIQNDIYVDLLSENAPLKNFQKIKGFFSATNIVFISLAFLQMVLLMIMAILELQI